MGPVPRETFPSSRTFFPSIRALARYYYSRATLRILSSPGHPFSRSLFHLPGPNPNVFPYVSSATTHVKR